MWVDDSMMEIAEVFEQSQPPFDSAREYLLQLRKDSGMIPDGSHRSRHKSRLVDSNLQTAPVPDSGPLLAYWPLRSRSRTPRRPASGRASRLKISEFPRTHAPIMENYIFDPDRSPVNKATDRRKVTSFSKIIARPEVKSDVGFVPMSRSSLRDPRNLSSDMTVPMSSSSSEDPRKLGSDMSAPMSRSSSEDPRNFSSASMSRTSLGDPRNLGSAMGDGAGSPRTSSLELGSLSTAARIVPLPAHAMDSVSYRKDDIDSAS